MTTEVLVLAAGRGSRLGARSETVPKWLLDVGAVTIAERQLEAIERAASEAGEQLASVRVVTGHAAVAVDRFLSDRNGIEVATVHNPEYARLNNWYSVLLGLRTQPEDVDRVAIVNADLFAPTEWLATFFADAAAVPGESLIGIDLERPLTDESMKVGLRNSGGEHVVDVIGKVGVERPAGEYVGLLMAGGSVLRDFREALEAFVGDDAATDAWYEQAVAVTAANGTEWRVWPTPGSDWIEIDDEADYTAAVGLEQDG
jgi:choline kinase